MERNGRRKGLAGPRRTARTLLCGAVLLLCLGCSSTGGAASEGPPAKTQAIPPADAAGTAVGEPLAEAPFALELPAFQLDDPHGDGHASADLVARGLVLVISAPTMANEEVQKAWVGALLDARPAGTAKRLGLLEDMEAAWFDELALERMREEDDPDAPPALLIDEDGAVRAALGVAEEATAVLVYSPAGKLLAWTRDEPSEADAQKLWRVLLEAEPE